jgi:hypothetical protein
MFACIVGAAARKDAKRFDICCAADIKPATCVTPSRHSTKLLFPLFHATPGDTAQLAPAIASSFSHHQVVHRRHSIYCR